MTKIMNENTFGTDNVVAFDVDETLVTADYRSEFKGQAAMEIGGVYWYSFDDHIERLKQFKARGHTVIVWSAGGRKWATEVCDVFGITSYVDLIMCKPKWYFDDKPGDAWMQRCFNYPQGEKK